MHDEILTSLEKSSGKQSHIFAVMAGIVIFRVAACTASDAIAVLKQHLRRRGNHLGEHRIAMSLVHAFEQKRLNFVVFNEERTQVICAELGGAYHWPVTLKAIDEHGIKLSENLRKKLLQDQPTLEHLLSCLAPRPSANPNTDYLM